MSEVKIRQEGDFLMFEWPETGIQAEVGYIRRHGGDLHAEVTWRSAHALGGPHLHWARLNLVSTTARRSMVKELQSRSGDDQIPWGDYMEAVAVHTAAKARGGPEVEIIEFREEPQPIVYRVEKLLEENQITVLYGRGGSGKSYIAAALALAVHSDLPFLDLDTKHGNVMYIDYETSKDEHDERFSRLMRGLGMREKPQDIRYCRMYQALADEVTPLRREIAQADVKLVVVDSLGAACGGEPESAEVVLRMFGALRGLGCTVLAIDHISAAQTEQTKRRRPFGSIYKENSPRSLWEVRCQDEPEATAKVIALHHRKNNSGPLCRTIGIKMDFENSRSTVLLPMEPASIPDFIPDLPLVNRLWAALVVPHNVAELAVECESTQGSVRATLNQHKDRFAYNSGMWARRAREEGPDA